MNRKLQEWMNELDQKRQDQDKLFQLDQLPRRELQSSRGELFQLYLADRSDVEDLNRIQEAAYGEDQLSWRSQDLRRDVVYNLRSFYLVACNSQEEPVAFLGAWILEEDAHISNLCVKPSYHRQGLASGLLTDFILMMEQQGVEVISLEVRAGNHPAQSLYQKFGFRRLVYLEGYYQRTQEDAIRMVLKLGENNEVESSSNEG